MHLSSSHTSFPLHPHSVTAGTGLCGQRSKRKADGEVPEGSFPTGLKRRAITRSYAIADLEVSFQAHVASVEDDNSVVSSLVSQSQRLR